MDPRQQRVILAAHDVPILYRGVHRLLHLVVYAVGDSWLHHSEGACDRKRVLTDSDACSHSFYHPVSQNGLLVFLNGLSGMCSVVISARDRAITGDGLKSDEVFT